MEIKEETPEEAQEMADSGGELVEPPAPAPPIQEQSFFFPNGKAKGGYRESSRALGFNSSNSHNFFDVSKG